MSESISVDANQIVRVIDTGTRAEIETHGRIDKDKQDHLKITGNGTNRVINIEADNDDSTVADVMCHITGKGDGGLNAGSDTDMWRTCPWLRAISDPAFAVTFMDDFLTFDDTDDWIATDVGTSSGTVACVSGFGGILEIDTVTTTTDKGMQIQLTTPSFLPAAGNKIWFETRLKVTDTVTKVQLFAGLTIIDTTVTATGEMSTADYIGWLLDKTQQGATASTPMLEINSTAGAAEAGGVATLVEDTYIRLGFIVDGVTSVTPYVNGVAGTATATGANIPLVALTPTICANSHGTNDPIVSVDWVKVCQLR